MKIKCLLILLFALILHSCGKEIPNPGNVQPVANTAKGAEKKLLSELDTFYLGKRLVRVEKATKRDFDRLPAPAVDTSETSNLNRDSQWVKRVGDTLFFKTDTREVVVVSNTREDAEENYEGYRYCGLLENMGQFLISGTYYESDDYLLVDRQTGDITNLWGRPVASPDGKLFIVGNCDLEAAFTYNGLQLYKNIHKPVQVAQRELQQWGAYDIKWLDNNTLLVKAGMWNNNGGGSVQTEYLKLVLE